MNFNNFKGGLNSVSSPYQLGENQLSEMKNLDIDNGGLKLRSGTVAKYGPFADTITNIQKAIDSKDNKLIFVDTTNKLELVINGTLAQEKFDIAYPTKIIQSKTGFYIRKDNLLYTLKEFVCRGNVAYAIPYNTYYYIFLNKTEFDFMSDGIFPANLNGRTIIDARNGKLYYCQNNVNCNNQTIYTELLTSNFKYLGIINTFIRIYSNSESAVSISGISLLPSSGTIGIQALSISSLLNYIQLTENSSTRPAEAIQSDHIIWHPASMRYFAAGNKANPRALYISNPNDITIFQTVNILYPHLNLGKITSLSVAEKSVLVGYEFGWSHYVGLDPTTDAQWSLLSIPDGCKYGKTVMPTPSTISFFTSKGMIGFSTSLLMLQTMYTPSANQYKAFSKGKIGVNSQPSTCTAFYTDGKYYLVVDDTIYIYNYLADAFILYSGLAIKAISEDFDGKVMLAHQNYVVSFDETVYTDFEPQTGTKKAISFSASFPIVGIAKDNEVAKITTISVKSLSEQNGFNATLSVESEIGKTEYPLTNTENYVFENGDWIKSTFHARMRENLFQVDLSGNVFLIRIFGETDVATPQDFNVLNIFVDAKKERNKLC